MLLSQPGEPEVGVSEASLLQDRLPVKFQDVKFKNQSSSMKFS